MHLYGSQTKILERGTKDEMRIFEALFNGSWPKLSTHALEKCFENPHFIFCSSFQNLRLGSITLPRQSGWTLILLLSSRERHGDKDAGLDDWNDEQKLMARKRRMWTDSD
jgi:hypothetical protein